MAEEFLDIVSENNELTGASAPRSQAHAQGLWHRTVHIYLFRRNGAELEFLVHLRSPFKDLHPNEWDTRIGGHIKSGSILEDSVLEELSEEIGLDVKMHDLIEGEWHPGGKFPNLEFTKVYFLEYQGKLEDLKFNDGEVQEAKWMEMEEIKKAITDKPEEWTGGVDAFIKIVDYLLEKINKIV